MLIKIRVSFNLREESALSEPQPAASTRKLIRGDKERAKEMALTQHKLQLLDGQPVYPHTPENNLREAVNLNKSIEVFKEMADTLLHEVELLNHQPPPDIKRGIDFYEEVQRFEVNLIRRALEFTGGHQRRAARLLGLKVTTLNTMIKRYGVGTDEAVQAD